MTPSGSSVQITRVLSVAPYGYFVQWTVRKPSSGSYRFTLLRSGGPNGPWEPVAVDLTDTYFCIDRFDAPGEPGSRRPNQLALFRQFFYRLVMTDPAGQQDDDVADTDPRLDRNMMRAWRRATHDFDLTLRYHGRPCAILKRRRWGVRCPKCSDAVLREGIKSTCTVCWATGFVGGYWTPAIVQAHRLSGDLASQNTPEQRSDSNSTRVQLKHFPEVERDDVLVFLHDNRRFNIEKVSQPEISNRTTHQLCMTSELDHGSILYRLKVDTAENPLL